MDYRRLRPGKEKLNIFSLARVAHGKTTQLAPLTPLILCVANKHGERLAFSTQRAVHEPPLATSWRLVQSTGFIAQSESGPPPKSI